MSVSKTNHINKYKIGTRDSLLATTQSGIIQGQLAKLSGTSFELVTTKTEGDLNTSVPLWQLDGKNFFTKELDSALLKGEVDLVVHSYKDLGSDRPEGISLAAVTERKYAHDILLIKKATAAKLNTLQSLVVGTSSPRRIVNIEKGLAKTLPHKDLKVETKMLRGNVNTRIKKLQNDEYHAIVLALAGLERLAQVEASRNELTNLLEDLTFLILPQSHFPSSASQGALGIETLEQRDDQGVLQNILKGIQHSDTVDEIQIEREIFQTYGGGCHLAVGIHCHKIDDHMLIIEKGKTEDKSIERIELTRPLPLPNIDGPVFLGMPVSKIAKTEPGFLYDQYIKKISTVTTDESHGANVFITSNYGLDQLARFEEINSLWVSGDRTLEAVTTAGYWVNGSADGLGHSEVAKLKESQAIRILLDEDPSWCVLSHDKAKSKIGPIVPCYTHELGDISSEFRDAINNCQAFYWTSYLQYQAYCHAFPKVAWKEKHHCCGLGKTYEQFKKNNINIIPFYKIQHFKEWVKS